MVETLLQISIWELVKNFNKFDSESIQKLPNNLIAKLFILLTKRGLVTDQNISLLITEKTRSIDLSQCEVSDDSLFRIAETCKNLSYLNVASFTRLRTSITSAGISKIGSHCNFLQALHLNRCIQVDDDSIIQCIKNCRHLRHLGLAGCLLISDKCLVAIGQNCCQLSSLNLSNTKVTDYGIFKLANGVCANSLRELHIDHLEGITDDSLVMLTQNCVNLRTLCFHNCPNVRDETSYQLASQLQKHHITYTIY